MSDDRIDHSAELAAIERHREAIRELEKTVGPSPGSPPPDVLPLDANGQPYVMREWLKDPSWFAAHKKEILTAASHGRVRDPGAWKVNTAGTDAARAAYRARQAQKGTAK